MQNKNETDNADDSALLKAKSDALRLLSFRPRSIEELKGRLRLKRYPEDLIGRVIESFKQQGLLDDAKFAKLFASSRMHSRPVGRTQLEIDLKKKGLSSELVAKTLAGLEDYDEKKTAKDLVWARFERMAGLPKEKKKARIYGFLKRRGFGDEVVFKVLDELFRESNV